MTDEFPLLGEALKPVLALADPDTAAFIRFRFGLATGEPHTLAEVADAFGITLEEARQVEREALNVVRHSDTD